MQFTTELGDAGQWIVCVAGELDLATADALASAMLSLLAAPNGEGLTLDLSAVTFMDCAGLSALIRIRNPITAAGRTLTLRNPSPAVLRVLTLTQLLPCFPIADDGRKDHR